MNGFEQLGLNHQLLEAITKLGFTEPTEIQQKSIPHIMEGKDVIGESATGSGKTLAFGCGIIGKAIPREGLQALVLTPTRELAEQVKDMLMALSSQKPLNIIAVYGGVSINGQINRLPRADVVIATPGRMLDHMRRRTIDTSRIKVLVLDEADRMLDMGFINDVEHIIRACPQKRQTLFFSATISPRIKSLGGRHLKAPAEVFAEKMVDPTKLKQFYYRTTRNEKAALLAHLLQSETSKLAMVFCNTRRSTDFVTRNLRKCGVRAIAIHGGLSQNQRTRVIEMFNSARANILVCTDVASRGLDIENVSHVYNYEAPKVANDYVHRIGRTARAGDEGKVINLLSESDRDNFQSIRREYREFEIESLDAPAFAPIPERPRDGGGHLPDGIDDENRGRGDNRGGGNYRGRDNRRGNWGSQNAGYRGRDDRNAGGNYRGADNRNSGERGGGSGNRASGGNYRGADNQNTSENYSGADNRNSGERGGGSGNRASGGNYRGRPNQGSGEKYRAMESRSAPSDRSRGSYADGNCGIRDGQSLGDGGRQGGGGSNYNSDRRRRFSNNNAGRRARWERR